MVSVCTHTDALNSFVASSYRRGWEPVSQAIGVTSMALAYPHPAPSYRFSAAALVDGRPDGSCRQTCEPLLQLADVENWATVACTQIAGDTALANFYFSRTTVV